MTSMQRLGVMVIGMFLCPVTLGHFGCNDCDQRHTRALLPSLLRRGLRTAFERERAAQLLLAANTGRLRARPPVNGVNVRRRRRDNWYGCRAGAGRARAVCDDDDLVPTFILALVALPIRAEELNASPLTRNQVVAIRANAHCVMVPLPVKAEGSTTGLA
jgi:hypothetical protein